MKQKITAPAASFHPLLTLAELLYDRFLSGRKLRLKTELETLFRRKKDAIRQYYVKKIADIILVTLIMIALVVLILVYAGSQDRRIVSGRIVRPDYGQSDQNQDLSLSVSGQKESEDVSVHISSRKYSEKEAKKLMKKAEKEFQEGLAGDNASLDEVRRPLHLPETLQNGAVKVSTYISPYGIIDPETGEITGRPDKNGTDIIIRCSLTLQDQETDIEQAAVVYPPILTDEEQFQADLDLALEEANEKDPASAYISLPGKVKGRRLSWSHPKETSYSFIILAAFLLPLMIWIEEDEQVKQKYVVRKDRLDLDYSELLFKMTLLLGAGMTIRGAFSRVFVQAKGSSPVLHPVYDEIGYMLREIKSGVPEETAYENFGRRCGLPQYIKLGSLLAQNLRKGSRGLTDLLEREASMSLQEHRTIARQLGEKASMKMLMPMILMLLDVMVILMVPAFLSM